MRWYSTRSDHSTTLSDALSEGLAPDGGLYVPDAWPAQDWPPEKPGAPATVGGRLLQPFFAGDRLGDDLGGILSDALNFPLPLASLAPNLDLLELYHGPTAAFKDVGARFLAAALTRLIPVDRDRPLTIVVATSGDTGGAVAAAFHRLPGFRVVVLFPNGQVSPRQAHQLSAWGDNVVSLAVEGTFDDCQRLAKAAFADPELSALHRFSSANSINVGRLLPQMIYYATSSLEIRVREGRPASYVIPTGNLGNALAAIWARRLGLPIDEIVLATNANQTIPDYLSTGQWAPRSSIATVANAMDVGDPSNMERLRHLVPEFELLRDSIAAHPVTDAQIVEEIRRVHGEFGRAICPHTATGTFVYEQLPKAKQGKPWVVVATAHPAKFETVVEPAIGETVPLPPALAEILALPARAIKVSPSLESVSKEL